MLSFEMAISSVLNAKIGENAVVKTGFLISISIFVKLLTLFSTNFMHLGLETVSGNTFKYNTNGILARTAAAHITPPITLIFFFILSSTKIIS